MNTRKTLLALATIPLIGLAACGTSEEKSEESSPQMTTQPMPAQDQNTDPQPTQPGDASPAAETASEPAQADGTREQKNALQSAERYLSFSSFSDEGLRKQLDFEGFPPDAIEYAMQNITVDWNEQAVKKAHEYQEVGGMSDSGLYDQLIFEGFTPEQAQYGVDNM